MNPSTFSFPSGHTASSFGATTTLYRYHIPGLSRKTLKSIIYFVAGTIAFSRLYLGLHYFTDLMGGASLGILCSLWVMQKVKPVLENK